MLTEEEFRLFRNLIYEESGIYLKETKKDFLENRVVKRMSETKTTSPYWYYKLVTDARNTELMTLLDLMTVNETSFFRNRPQLELFRSVVLPDSAGVRVRAAADLLRIWSAGCSTGEEPYTIAMIVREALLGAWARDVRIFASDLSLSVLAGGPPGGIRADKVQATVDDHYLARYFTRNGSMQVKDGIRKMVAFDFHNLKNDNGLGDLDVIFCRNVMIYFDMKSRSGWSANSTGALKPGGYLFIGHAESIQGWNMGLQFVYHNGGTAYKKPNPEGHHEDSYRRKTIEISVGYFPAHCVNSGFEVDLAVDGVEAVLKCMDRKYDFVLLDIKMPRLDGINALRIIKKMDSERAGDDLFRQRRKRRDGRFSPCRRHPLPDQAL